MEKNKKLIIFTSISGILLFTLGIVLDFITRDEVKNDIFLSQEYNLSTIYSQKIVSSMKEYFENNSNDLLNLNDGESYIIDTKEIINDTQFQTCSGTLKITKIGDIFEYLPNATCQNEEKGAEITYKIYTGSIDNAFITEDSSVFVSSYKNVVIANNDSTSWRDSADLIITMYDSNGNLKWSTGYERKNGAVQTVDAVNKLDDIYYVTISDGKENHVHILKYDSNGNLIDDVIIEGKNTEVSELTYIGKNNETLYYMVTNTSPKVVAINKDGYKLLFDDEYYEGDVYPFYMSIGGEYIYGVENLYPDDDTKNYSNNDVIGIKLSKFDLDGNLIKEETILKNEGALQEGFVATDNYIYVSYFSKKEDDLRIAKFTKDLELVTKDVNYRNEWNKKVETYNFRGDTDKLYFTYTDDTNYYIKVTNENDETIDKYKTIEDDYIYANYFLEKTKYINDKLVQIYSEYNSFDEDSEIIIAFYSKNK